MYKSKFQSDAVDGLFKAILLLENVEECYRFFEDLCTVGELHSLAQRMEVAKLLDRNKTYIEIAKQTNASTATISRINRALEYGADGYKVILERLKERGE